MHGNRELFFCIWLVCFCTGLFPKQACAATGHLQLHVMFAGKPIAAAVRITEKGKRNRVVLQNEYRGGDSQRHMQSTPYDIELPAGKYDLFVHAYVSPMRIYLQTRAIPIEISTGDRLDKTVVIPSGRLRIASEVEGQLTAGMKVDITASAAYRDRLPGFENYTATAHQTTPVDIAVPPGRYHFKVWNRQAHTSREGSLVVANNKLADSRVRFKALHAGYLKTQVIVDGRRLSPDENSRYVSLSIREAGTGKRVTPLPGDSGDPGLKLPEGDYTVKVRDYTLNANKHIFEVVRIHADQTKLLTVKLQQPGNLTLSARWSGQPMDFRHFGDCMHYYNPLNKAHLGALMGGPSVSPGKCADSQIRELIIHVTDNQGRQLEQTTTRDLRLLPGRYNIEVWPKGYRGLKQTLKDIKITAHAHLQKQLTFQWQADSQEGKK